MNRKHLTSAGAATGNGMNANRGKIWKSDHLHATKVKNEQGRRAAGPALAAPEIANQQG
jgi:hypothetical protein